MRLEPTYEGLKGDAIHTEQVSTIGLEPTYEGLKDPIPSSRLVIDIGLEPTYEGLKVYLLTFSVGCTNSFGAYL